MSDAWPPPNITQAEKQQRTAEAEGRCPTCGATYEEDECTGGLA